MSRLAADLGRPAQAGGPSRTVRAGLAVGAAAVLGLAISGPIDRLAHEHFPWHMAQHLLMVLAAAPMLAAALPLRPVVSTSRAATTAVVAAALHGAVLVTWHVPPAYDAALAHPPLHAFEHLTLLGTATLAWWTVRRCRVAGHLGGMLLGLAVLSLVGAGLGAMLLTSPESLYAAHAGPDGLTGQRLGGAMMKAASLAVHGLAAGIGAATWFAALDDGGARATPVR